MKSFNVTQVQEWMRCRTAWKYRYVERLKPVEVGEALSFGRMVHEAIAARLAGSNDPLRAGEWGGGELSAYVAGAEEAARALADAAVERAFAEGWRTECAPGGEPLIERKIRFPMPDPPGGEFVAVVDWVAREESTGAAWVVEWKVRTALRTGDGAHELSLQMAAYRRALEELGVEVYGFATIQVCGRPPAAPKRNADGTMSRALIRTTWQEYCRALREAGLDPQDYLDVKRKLETVEWVRVDRSWTDPALARRVWEEDVVPACQDMVDAAAGRLRIYRLLSPRICEWCQYQPLCAAELMGEDVDAIKEYLYRVRSVREEEAADA